MIKKTLIVFGAALLAISVTIFFKGNNEKKIETNKKSESSVLLQILPNPKIINKGIKDDSITQALLNKDSKAINISNATIDFADFTFAKNLELENNKITFRYNSTSNRLEFEGQGPNDLSLSGYYLINQQNKIESEIKIFGDNFKLSISGSYFNSTEQDEEKYNGKFEITTSSLFSFANNIESIKKNLPTLKTDEKAVISGLFEYDGNKFIISSAKCVSDNLEAEFKANNSISSGQYPDLEIDIKRANLDNILHNSKNSRKDLLLQQLLYTLENLIGSTNSNIIINAQKISYNKKYINDFFAKTSIDSEQLNIEELKFQTQNSMSIKSKGVFSKNQFRPIYKGTIHVDSKNFSNLAEILLKEEAESLKTFEDISFDADIIINPVTIEFDNLLISNPDMQLSGDLRISSYGSKFNIVNSNLEFTNLDNNPKVTIFQNFFDKLNITNNSENGATDLTSRLNSFKKMNSIYDIGISIHNFDINDSHVDQLSGEFIIRPSLFKIDDLRIDSAEHNLNGNISVDVSAFKPILSFIIEGQKTTSSLLSKFFMPKSTSNELSNNKQQNNEIYNKTLELLRLDNFDGQVAFKINKVTGEKADLKDFILDMVIENNMLKVRKANANLFNGYLQTVGNITLNPLAFNIAYAYSNLDLGEYSKFSGSNITGLANLSGNVYGKGNNLKEIISTLGGATNFAAKDVGVRNLNINAVVNTYGPYALGKDVAINKSSSVFNNISGKFDLLSGIINYSNLSFSSNNINGRINGKYDILNQNQSSNINLAYTDATGRVDSFDISLTGNLLKPKVQLGRINLN